MQLARTAPALFARSTRSRLDINRGVRFVPSASNVITTLQSFGRRNLSTDQGSTPETPTGQQYTFKAETTKILDIVSKSLYSERDVFLRELVSNASDALEKLRFHSATSAAASEGDSKPVVDRPLEIRIETDKVKKTLVISDSGIGMTKAEMLENLGTIGKSGSADFIKDNKNSAIIGKFGVGFYSAFMVGDQVEVLSRSVKGTTEDAPGGYIWRSHGTESFTLEPVKSYLTPVGTTITIHLRDEDFADPQRVRGVIERYSNFVSYPIFLNGERINKIEAIWAEEPSKVDATRHSEFYKFTFSSFEDPLYTLHFRTDAPIDLKALLYIPTHNPEQLGMARVKPGVSLFTRKVLLKKEADILPQWARFVQGIVDSEDLPLSLSRETAQDKRLVDKMGKAVTRRLLRFLRDKSTNDPKGFQGFWREFGHFVKEGICSDFDNQPELAKLLRYDTSLLKSGEPYASLDEILSRMGPTQKNIYYLSAPNRTLAEKSPYYELFKKKNVEVIFLYHTLDDFVMSNLKTFEGRSLVAAESDAIEDNLKENQATPASEQVSKELCDWIKAQLGDAVSSVKISTRLEGFPALVVDHESASLRRMMKMVNPQDSANHFLPKQKLEINPKHKLIQSLEKMRKDSSQSGVAKKLARVIFDGALIQAGIVDDPRDMQPRYNEVLEELLEAKLAENSSNEGETTK